MKQVCNGGLPASAAAIHSQNPRSAITGSVRAYLDIESLRLGDRLKVEQTIDPRSLDALVPPFSFQPLVENAVQHGIQSSSRAGRLLLTVRPSGSWLEMGVSDDGQGVPSTEVEQLFFGERPRVHALVLLRRRLQGLFGRSFQLEVRSEIGEGTTVSLRIPLRRRFGVNMESPGAITYSRAADGVLRLSGMGE